MYEFLSWTKTFTCCQELCAELQEQVISLTGTLHRNARTVYMSIKKNAQNCKNILHAKRDSEQDFEHSECKSTMKLSGKKAGRLWQTSEAAASEHLVHHRRATKSRRTCHSRNVQTHRSAKIHIIAFTCTSETYDALIYEFDMCSVNTMWFVWSPWPQPWTFRRICLQQWSMPYRRKVKRRNRSMSYSSGSSPGLETHKALTVLPSRSWPVRSESWSMTSSSEALCSEVLQTSEPSRLFGELPSQSPSWSSSANNRATKQHKPTV